MDSSQLRIGDAEREAAVAALADHYAAGRLTKGEFDERSNRAWAAKSRAGLAPLFFDLPAPHDAAQAGAGVTRPARPRGFPWFVFLVVLVALTVFTHVPWILLAILVAVVFSKARRFHYASGSARSSRGSWR